jgi:glycerol uptake facilitator-like aquaporin
LLPRSAGVLRFAVARADRKASLESPKEARARWTMTVSLSRRLASEALGTGLLLATVVGSGIMAERLALGNTAIALLGNTLPTGAILVVLITVLGPISGAHFNPVVSGVMVARRELDVTDFAAYVAVQIVGAVVGVILAHAMFDLPFLQTSVNVRTGSGQWIAEVVATFGLVITIIGTLRARPEFVPMAVGLYITAAYWFTASTSFANPAVTLARALTDTFAGIRPIDAPGFIAAQIAGAALAVVLGGFIFGTERARLS